jgi:hypothetical protein
MRAGQTARKTDGAPPEGDTVAEVMIFPFAEMSHSADSTPRSCTALLQKRQGLHYPVGQSRPARFVIDVAAQEAPAIQQDPGLLFAGPAAIVSRRMAYPTEPVMATDAEIDAAVKAMRAIRTVGGKIHDDVLRAYARAALEAANRLQMEEFRKRAEQRQQHQGNGSAPSGQRPSGAAGAESHS